MAMAFSFQAWSADTPAAPTSNSGPQSGWKSTDALKLHLIKQSLAVKPVNNYYHPVTLKIVGPITS